MLLAGLIGPKAEQLQERDQDSLTARLMMWNSGLQIIRDYPPHRQRLEYLSRRCGSCPLSGGGF